MNSSIKWIYGIHSVEAILNNKKRKIRRLCVLKSLVDTFEPLVRKRKDINLEVVDKGFFISTFGKNITHQGCAIQVVEDKEIFLEDVVTLEGNAPIVILDHITDPHNIGAIIRSCAVFGARAVVVQDAGSPEVTSVIAKTACGAMELVPLVRVTNIARSMEYLKENGFWCIGLGEDGTDVLSKVDLKGKFAFVIGSEGDGMRRLTRESCDIIARLPSSEQFSTLNAAQACTVTLYESFRQRFI